MSSTPSSLTRIKSEFLAGITDVSSFADELYEVAFVGKSNVGKSTIVNRLTGQKKLARAGSRPGLTKTINLFTTELENGYTFQLADLPGYGYAKVGKQERAELLFMIDSYLPRRKNLSILCLLVDIRRDPGSEELKIIAQCARRDIRQVVVLTKCDTVKKAEIAERRKEISASLGLESSDCILMGEGWPVSPLIEHISSLLKVI